MNKITKEAFEATYCCNERGNKRFWVAGDFYSDHDFNKIFEPVQKKKSGYYKTVRTMQEIKKDERIEKIIPKYDGSHRWMVECKSGFKFEGERTIEIGTIAEICYSINNNLEIIG